jgi:hypothetical protein
MSAMAGDLNTPATQPADFADFPGTVPARRERPILGPSPPLTMGGGGAYIVIPA